MSLSLRRTPATLSVLHELLVAPTDGVWGLRIIKATDRPAGTIYPILARLEAAKLVESLWQDPDDRHPGPRRRYYTLTADGRSFAARMIAEESGRQPAEAAPQTVRPVLAPTALNPGIA
jgi:PadR family transcriptional regulator PadR